MRNMELGNIMEKKYKQEELREMEKTISDFFEKEKLTLFRTDYVDPILIARELGFSVYSIQLGNRIDGLIGVDDKPLLGTNSNKIIIVNKNAESSQFKRFIVAHELAHYIDNKGNKSFAFRDSFSQIRSEHEQKMDYYAAAILMPIGSIISDISIIEKNIDKQSLNDQIIIDLIAKKYDVDQIMAERRLHEARIYRYGDEYRGD